MKGLIPQTQPIWEQAAPQYAWNSSAMSSLFGKFEGFRFSHLSWQKALQLGMPEVGHSCSVLIALQPPSLLSGSNLGLEDHGSSTI